MPHALSTIVRTEGARALFQGLVPALLTNVPFSTIHYALYRQFQSMLLERMGEGTALNFGSGACASVLATLLTQPFDVMRTRAMLNLPMFGMTGGKRARARRGESSRVRLARRRGQGEGGVSCRAVASSPLSVAAVVCRCRCLSLPCRTRGGLAFTYLPSVVAGLLAGMGPRLAKRSLQTAALWTLYEELWAMWKKAQVDGAAAQ